MGAKFLHSRYANLHRTPGVELVAQQNSIPSSADPVRKIEAWLRQNQIEFENAAKPQGGIARQMLKEQQYPNFLTERDNVPEEFFVRQQELARQLGHGYIELSAEYRQRVLDMALADEKQSLDHWLDYFLSADSNDKPIWFKQWVLFSIRKLGKFDPETGRFAKKSAGTLTPFPDFNPESLSLLWDVVVKQATSSAEFKEVIDFGTLYGRLLRENKAKIIDTNSNDGRWVIYPQGSDHQPLVTSLKGMNTGWCTAGTSTAQMQLSAGDFHVFYTRIGQVHRFNTRYSSDLDF